MAALDGARFALIDTLAALGGRQRSASPCAACGASEVVTLAARIRDRDGFGVVACGECGLGRLDPLPVSTVSYYEGDFVKINNPGKSLLAVRSSGIKTEDAERRIVRLAGVLTSGAQILEVGCHAGTFLQLAQLRSAASFTGTELDRGFREELQREGFDVRSTLEDCAGQSFDAIMVFHVLEHIARPVEFLQAIGRLLGPSGRLVIEVPNLTDALLWTYTIPKYRDHYWRYAHVWYFSAAPLRRLLETAGFAVDRLEPIQRYGLLNHLQWLSEGRPGPGEQFSSLVSREMDQEYRDAIIRTGRADTLWAECHLVTPCAV